MLAVCCFLWSDPSRQRSYTFDASHVRILRNMVARHLTLPHRFVCITDDRIDGIETVPIDWRTHVPGTCGVKLMAWRPDIGEVLGCDCVLTLDLDIVVVDSLDVLAGRREPAVLWRNPNYVEGGRRAFYQGSVQLHGAGKHPEVWTEIFKPGALQVVNRRFGGFEQAWLSEVLPWNLPHWTAEDGLYGAGRLGDLSPNGVGTELPGNARIVALPGNRAPHQPETQAKHPWIKASYR